jgi:hypothetical protein
MGRTNGSASFLGEKKDRIWMKSRGMGKQRHGNGGKYRLWEKGV